MLEIADLSTPLVGPVSVSADPGECIAIQGPSGSGKTLFMRAIVDLDPNEGSVRLGDWRREHMPAYAWRRHVALVPSESGWWADRVGDHFEDGSDAPALLDALGIPDALTWSVDRLSSGERQRAALARALVHQPAALLLDEPTAALDAGATKRVEALIRQQCSRGVVVILVTHDPDQATRMARRRLFMRRGSLYAGGDGAG